MLQFGARVWVAVLSCSVAACSGRVGEQGPLRPADAQRRSQAGASGADNADAAAASSGSSALTPAASSARRLSNAELDHTLRDLLADTSSPATRLLAEDLYSPFDNDYPSQAASGALIDSLEAMASEVATRALADASGRKRLVPCTPSGAGDAACFRKTVESFGKRAFRRPLTSSEIDAYMPLLAYATENNPAVPHDFYTAVELVVRAVLQDPEFLYRIEVGTKTGNTQTATLDEYELAARMSYLLWGTMPDDALLADADAGRLSATDSRRTIAQRMLGDTRAKDQLHRFHAMWLGYRALPHPPELTNAFQRETNALLDRIVFDQAQSYLNLFTASETYLDTMLADHYGLPHPSGDAGWVAYGTSGRAGILSHGSVLSAFSKFTDTSPTQRGIFVRTRLLCQTIMPPPPNVAADKPPAGNQDAVCKYDRYLAHRTSSSCAGCHNQLDPIGFGLENYDIAGVYRTHDDGLPQCTITGAGEVVGHGTFSGPGELGRLLVDEALVQPCVTRQFMQFALGRKLGEQDQPAAEELSAAFAAGGYSFSELITSYVADPLFAQRSEEAP